ncbi:hypothetical protein AJ79_09419 [Helicocarpus griseus UAMH5409]|uniref:Aminoglycoside phosphotransferase domain-containing protein n=1 Tax=Helicocarpus griseus UAMH5409 TaxID=1447875 RepID=A0A2B7WK19_9EURO|nr:hypothetical protein AJ79_09419 [Helicocarpus griseus UAMH5409]
MVYMPGETLDKAWTGLTSDQKASTCRQIAEYLAQVRQLKGKGIEAVDGAPVRLGYYQSRCGGPFTSEKKFNDILARDSHQRPAENHAIHFAHGDLSPRNILVNKEGRITAVLGWEWAGWFPEYWDITDVFGPPRKAEDAELC